MSYYCHTHLHTCSLARTFIHTHVCTNTHTHTTHTYAHASHTHTYTHTYTHTHTHTHIYTTQITHPSTKTFSRSLQEGELSPTSSSTGNRLADAMTSLPSTRADSWLNCSCRVSRPGTQQTLTIHMTMMLWSSEADQVDWRVQRSASVSSLELK